MDHREYGWQMNDQYEKLLTNLEILGTLLQESNFAEYENQVISFDYLSYSFQSKFHAVIFEGELVLKVRFETQVFSESVFHFDVLINYFGNISAIDLLVPERNLNYFSSNTIEAYFDRLLGQFLEKSDFYHENSIGDAL
ncbi:hypothetical protein WKW58_03295 [Vibrio alginolyticus]|uniref:hypothetical protein n=1 Tax=Vibrio TaxID=662 RepID=UPI001CDCDF33|nr:MULTISPECIES: hypothetical protein [Vibrio]MCA2484863.1 hypothetical protein [Vibrio alginolyticus]MDW2281169.1 hypothetical protein [Vibrio sp. 1402]